MAEPLTHDEVRDIVGEVHRGLGARMALRLMLALRFDDAPPGHVVAFPVARIVRVPPADQPPRFPGRHCLMLVR